MTALESHVLGLICFVLGITFGFLNSLWLALVFCIAAFGCFAWAVYKESSGGGGGSDNFKSA